MSTTINPPSRAINTLREVAPGLFLRVSTTHNRGAKTFMTTATRETHVDGIVRYRLHLDTKLLDERYVSRYSEKGLREVHAQFSDWIQHPAYTGWAMALVPDTIES